MTKQRNCALALGSILLVPAALQAALIDISVATNKTRYSPGEALIFSVTAHNRDPQDAVLAFGSTLQAQYILDGTFTRPEIGATVLTYRQIPANGSHTWQYRYGWSRPLDLGTHYIVGRVIGFGDSSTVPFEVVEPVLPTESFVMDFDSLPLGSPMYSGEESWPFGIYFRGADGGSRGVGERNGNHFIDSSNMTTYPTGSNIIADFKMPVYGVTVDVRAAAGRTVTMIAKDASGLVLNSVTSEPVPDSLDFIGPLTITSDTPIASLEWWPSDVRSKVQVDNLQVIIPEPASTLSLALGATLFVLRRSRRTA